MAESPVNPFSDFSKNYMKGSFLWRLQQQEIEEKNERLTQLAFGTQSKEDVVVERQKAEVENEVNQVLESVSKNSKKLEQALNNIGSTVETASKEMIHVLNYTVNEAGKEMPRVINATTENLVNIIKEAQRIGIENLSSAQREMYSAVQQTLTMGGLDLKQGSTQQMRGTSQAGLEGPIVGGAVGGVAATGLLTKLKSAKGSHGPIGSLLTHAASHKIPFAGSALGLLSKTGALGLVDNPYTLAAVAIGEGVGQIASEIRQTRQAGMVTGEGFTAGISAKLSAFRTGMNPFDMVTVAMAEQIMGAVRTQGFRDRTSTLMTNTIGDVINRFGTDMQTTIDIVTLGVRGQTLASTGPQVTTAMNAMNASLSGLADFARAMGTSVPDLTSQVQSWLQAYPALGPGAAALTFALGGPSVAGQSVNSYVQSQNQILSMMGGGKYWNIGLQQGEPSLIRGTGILRTMAERAQATSGLSKLQFANLWMKQNVLGLGHFKDARQVEALLFGSQYSPSRIRSRFNDAIFKEAFSAGHHAFIGEQKHLMDMMQKGKLSPQRYQEILDRSEMSNYISGVEKYLKQTGDKSALNVFNKFGRPRLEEAYRKNDMGLFQNVLKGMQHFNPKTGHWEGKGLPPLEITLRMELQPKQFSRLFKMKNVDITKAVNKANADTGWSPSNTVTKSVSNYFGAYGGK